MVIMYRTFTIMQIASLATISSVTLGTFYYMPTAPMIQFSSFKLNYQDLTSLQDLKLFVGCPSTTCRTATLHF